MADIIRGAVIGYGAAFNMGKAHANMMQSTDGIECVAICDIDPERTVAAKADFPHVRTYNKVAELLADDGVDLVANVLPHSLHAPVTVDTLKAGKHAVVEKPMCITIAEATEMINTARENGLMLSVHHNRRWDRDFWTLRELVQSGIIGQVFSVDMWGGGYGRPNPDWWRSVKAVSGGAFYDWGAHYIDWLLNVIEEKMVNVTGFYHPNLVWKDITNEDHVQAIIRFANGTVANVQMSNIAKIGGQRWKLLGSHGAITSNGDHFKVLSEVEGQPAEQEVQYHGRPGPSYYQNIVAHLNDGEPLIVTPESARRVIAVMDLAEKSSKTHQAETVPYEFED
jgi:scyllo-inositol 2-dehydrogenase (NADP+)